MTTEERALVFIQLGTFLTSYLEQAKHDPSHLPGSGKEEIMLTQAIRSTLQNNPWFILPNVLLALESIAASLAKKDVAAFATHYKSRIERQNHTVRVGVVMAGNIPAVGFHDLFCVILSGNRFIGKLSSEDKYLLPALGRLMMSWDRGLEPMISFPEGKLASFDAVIATGSDNTARYFNYYFGKYPHIIRKNRSSVAVVNGRESPAELTDLGIDVFSHFGRGCRNVSKLYLPEGYPTESLFQHWTQFREVCDHSRYRNNYDYFKTIYIINNLPFLDNGQIILLGNTSFHTPVSVVHYEFFRDIHLVNLAISQNLDSLQCIVSADPAIDNRIPFGSAQAPGLFDFADRIDTMEFLTQVGMV